MNNLSKNVLKQLLINGKGYPFLKNLFQKTKFFVKICPIRTNFETTLCQSINHAKFVYCCQETFEMGVYTTESRLSINSCCKFPFFPRYFYIKKWQLSVFLLFKGKRHVQMISIKIITKFQDVLHRFEQKQKCHQHIFYKKTGLNFFGTVQAI